MPNFSAYRKATFTNRRAHRLFHITIRSANAVTSNAVNLRNGFLPEESRQSLKSRNGRMPIASRLGCDVCQDYLFHCGTVASDLRTSANNAEDYPRWILFAQTTSGDYTCRKVVFARELCNAHDLNIHIWKTNSDMRRMESFAICAFPGISWSYPCILHWCWIRIVWQHNTSVSTQD